MADTIDVVQPDQPPTPPPPPPPPPQETVVDTMQPAIPVQEAPPPPEGCFAKRSGLEKCLIIFVIIILIIVFFMVIAAVIYYFFVSPPEGTCLSDGCVRSASRLKDHMDGDLDPCNSFYEYACHGWSKRQILGPDQKKLDMETQMKKDHLMRLRTLLSTGVDRGEQDFTKKPKLFYKSCMNVEKLDELGTEPFFDVVKKVGKFPALDSSWNNSNGDFNFQDTLVKLAKLSVWPLFELQVEKSDVDPKKNRLYISDGHLSLDKKEHYVGERDSKILSAYQEWMVNTLVLLGADRQDAEEDVEKVIEFEIRLAKLRRDDSTKASFKSTYESYNVNKIKGVYPWVDWLEFIQSAGASVYIGKNEVVVIKEPEYFEHLGPLINGTSKRVMANFLMSRLLPLTANLGTEFIAEHEKYAENVLGEKPEDRWKYCAVYTSKQYDAAVGRMFADQYFNKEAKDHVTTIVDDVVTSFRDQLVDTNWMTVETRGIALTKLENVAIKIGYPDSLLDDEALTELYTDVSAHEEKLMSNSASLMKLGTNENIKKLRDPVESDVWTVSPTSMDGRYDIESNELVLPAGFLQTPVYNPEFSNAMNYAGVASTVGREIIHGFDQSGRLYNAEGSKENWWKQSDEEGFKSQSACFIKQWACYKWDGESMSGDQALGENIAYNAGLKHGYEAYRAMIARGGSEEQRLPGLRMDNHQVFFLSYAQMWCSKYGTEARRQFIATSSHPPFPYRVFGTLQNSEPFSRAFDCPIGTRMNPREKCKLW